MLLTKINKHKRGCVPPCIKSHPVSVLLDERLAPLPGGGAELEEVLCCVSLHAGEESAIPFVAHREELGTSLRCFWLSSPCVVHRALTDVCHCYSE